MPAFKLPFDYIFTLERRAFFPAFSWTKVTANQELETFYLTLKRLRRRSTWNKLLVSTFWDLFLNLDRAPSTIITKMTLSFAFALVLGTKFRTTILLALVQRMITVIRMTNPFAHVTTRKPKTALQDTTAFRSLLEVICTFGMDNSVWMVFTNQFQRFSYGSLFIHVFDNVLP